MSCLAFGCHTNVSLMSNIHYRALCSRHPVRHSPAFSGLSSACLAYIIRTCLRSPAAHPPPLAHLPHPPHGRGSQSHGCRHPSRLLCPARAFGAAEQGAAKVAVVRTKVLLDQIGVVRKPCLQCHQTALLVQQGPLYSGSCRRLSSGGRRWSSRRRLASRTVLVTLGSPRP